MFSLTPDITVAYLEVKFIQKRMVPCQASLKRILLFCLLLFCSAISLCLALSLCGLNSRGSCPQSTAGGIIPSICWFSLRSPPTLMPHAPLLSHLQHTSPSMANTSSYMQHSKQCKMCFCPKSNKKRLPRFPRDEIGSVRFFHYPQLLNTQLS